VKVEAGVGVGVAAGLIVGVEEDVEWGWACVMWLVL